MSYIAPAGTAISPLTAASTLLGGIAGRGSHARLSAALAAHAGRTHGWLVSTGRAAMTVALTAMKRLRPERNLVIIPGYTCYSVPAAVKLAGLTPCLVDVDPLTLSPDLANLERVDHSRVLATVSANLYGIPNALTELEAFAHAHGVFLLDDAAQALGATVGNRPVGGFGDAGLYSFDKGKNITSIEGGALVASDPALSRAIEARCAMLTPTSAARTASTAAKLLVYSVMLRPSAYGLVNRMPLGLGQTRWEDDYPLGQYSPVLAAVALRLFERLAQLTATRRQNAATLTAALRDVPGVRLPGIADGVSPAWARFPFFIEPVRRARAIAALQSAGIGATASYPQALCELPEVRRLLAADPGAQAGARAVAASIVTLPTHHFVPQDMGARVRAILTSI